jgi:hypothetical protein
MAIGHGGVYHDAWQLQVRMPYKYVMLLALNMQLNQLGLARCLRAHAQHLCAVVMVAAPLSKQF